MSFHHFLFPSPVSEYGKTPVPLQYNHDCNLWWNHGYKNHPACPHRLFGSSHPLIPAGYDYIPSSPSISHMFRQPGLAEWYSSPMMVPDHNPQHFLSVPPLKLNKQFIIPSGIAASGTHCLSGHCKSGNPVVALNIPIPGHVSFCPSKVSLTAIIFSLTILCITAVVYNVSLAPASDPVQTGYPPIIQS